MRRDLANKAKEIDARRDMGLKKLRDVATEEFIGWIRDIGGGDASWADQYDAHLRALDITNKVNDVIDANETAIKLYHHRLLRDECSNLVRPVGSTTGEQPGTDELAQGGKTEHAPIGNPLNAKPQCLSVDVGESCKAIPVPATSSAGDSTNTLLGGVHSTNISTIPWGDWMSNEGQAALLRMQSQNKGPSGYRPVGSAPMGLSPLNYAPGCLMPMTQNDGWHEIEMTADSGACDTVMPLRDCEWIKIHESLQSKAGCKYEVANGAIIPNLGERRCLIWSEGTSEPRGISLQVADVKKPLLSLSRCADLGYESRLGKVAGCLVDTETGETIPLQRKGNVYVLKTWIRDADFQRPGPP